MDQLENFKQVKGNFYRAKYTSTKEIWLLKIRFNKNFSHPIIKPIRKLSHCDKTNIPIDPFRGGLSSMMWMGEDKIAKLAVFNPIKPKGFKLFK